MSIFVCKFWSHIWKWFWSCDHLPQLHVLLASTCEDHENLTIICDTSREQVVGPDYYSPFALISPSGTRRRFLLVVVGCAGPDKGSGTGLGKSDNQASTTMFPRGIMVDVPPPFLVAIALSCELQEIPPVVAGLC